MSALINALDNRVTKKIGENGHAEYSYSDSLRERVIQLSFQLTRITKYSSMTSVENVLDDLLLTVKTDLIKNKWLSGVSIELLVVLYKMIGHTRDAQSGKGEYALAYMMIYVWEKHFPSWQHTPRPLLYDHPKGAMNHLMGLGRTSNVCALI